MNCPRCESTALRTNRRWECTGCGYVFKSRLPSTDKGPKPPPPPPPPRQTQPAMVPMAAVKPSSIPPPNRIRTGDVWLDIKGRRHLAELCVVNGLLVMKPLDHDLVPVAMDVSNPYPWRRVTWGGQP